MNEMYQRDGERIMPGMEFPVLVIYKVLDYNPACDDPKCAKLTTRKKRGTFIVTSKRLAEKGAIPRWSVSGQLKIEMFVSEDVLLTLHPNYNGTTMTTVLPLPHDMMYATWLPKWVTYRIKVASKDFYEKVLAI